MTRSATLPFTLKRSDDAYTMDSITTTTEIIHGLLRVDSEKLVIQWRVGRTTDLVGGEIRSDHEVDRVREVVVPLEKVSGALVSGRLWWWPLARPRILLTATDLRAFEEVTGPDGLALLHPAELKLTLRRRDRLIASEFAGELELAVAERSLAGRRRDPALGAGRPGPPAGRSEPEPGEEATSESPSG